MAAKAMRKVGVLAVMMALIAGTAQAQKHEETVKDWNVFTLEQGAEKTCYMVSAPTKKAGKFEKRGEPYMMVTHRGAKTDEVSVSVGFPYKVKSEIIVNIDGKLSRMFTKDELAWAYNEKSDNDIVALMKKSKQLVIKAEGQGANATAEDTYSLSGFTGAYKKMKELCK